VLWWSGLVNELIASEVKAWKQYGGIAKIEPLS
jgi:hypothetical protein